MCALNFKSVSLGTFVQINFGSKISGVTKQFVLSEPNSQVNCVMKIYPNK